MSQQHCLVSLRVIISHVSSDSSSWLSVPRNPHMTCEKPTQTYIPEKDISQEHRAWNTCIVHACVCKLEFMLLQMHLWVDIRSFSGHWSAEGVVIHVGFPAVSRASRDRITSPRQTILCSDHTSPCRNYSCAGVEVSRGCAPPSQRRTYISTPCLGRMAAGAGFHTRTG